MKKCSKCEIEKQDSEFNKDNSRKDKLYSSCKSCKKIKVRIRKKLVSNNPNMKTCIKCEVEKEKSEFNKDNSQKDKLHIRCRSCIKEINKECYEKNREKRNEINTKYRENHSEKIKEYNKKYRENYKPKRNEKERLKIQNDPLYKLSVNIRSLIRQSFKKKGYKKNTKTYKILDCSFEKFKKHLQKQFKTWMSWDNYGKYTGEFNEGWDIDHKIPLSSATTEEELIKLCHYDNLQPLCSKVNREIKRDKIDFEN